MTTARPLTVTVSPRYGELVRATARAENRKGNG